MKRERRGGHWVSEGKQALAWFQGRREHVSKVTEMQWDLKERGPWEGQRDLEDERFI